MVVCHSASAQDGTIKDIDGNVYHVIKIGTQRWMQENLKTAHYRDGTPIIEMENSAKWVNVGESKTGAWCYYDNNEGNNPTYGKLYNWYAVADTHHLCPTGWHVPSKVEWDVLTDYLGGYKVAGGRIKAMTLWKTRNKGADNSSGFTALPGGYRDTARTIFHYLGGIGDFWSSTENNIFLAWDCYLGYNYSKVYCGPYGKGNGYSVRCVGD